MKEGKEWQCFNFGVNCFSKRACGSLSLRLTLVIIVKWTGIAGFHWEGPQTRLLPRNGVCDAGQCQHRSWVVCWWSNLHSSVLYITHAGHTSEPSANAMSNAVNECEYIGNEFVNYTCVCVCVTGGPSALTEPQLKSCSERGGAC